MTRFAARRPPKCLIINMSTDEIKECQHNPARFARQHAANYGRLTVGGVGHQILQYSNTTNVVVPSLAFVMDKLVGNYDIEDFVQFMDALTVPARSVNGPLLHAPPLALFIWPGVFSFEAVVTAFQVVHERLAIDGTPLRTVVTVTLEEKRDLQKFSEEVRNDRALTAADIEDAFTSTLTISADGEFEFE